MKKLVSLMFIFFFSFFTFPLFVCASTEVKERSDNHYLVADWVTVTDQNRDNILKTPAVDASEKVYDFADLFTPSEEEQLYSKISQYIDSYDLDLVVVTINENNKFSPTIYADDFYDYNDFGIGRDRDGVLLLIDMQYRQIYMSTCGSAIKMYTDAKIDSVMDAVYTYMSSADYYEGVSNYIQIISDDAAKFGNRIINYVIYAMIGSFVITFIVMFILIRKNRLVRKATTAAEYLNQNTVTFENLGDVFMGSNTIKHHIDHTSSGGGSSTHSSSSGSSHGGGGHSF